MAIPKEKKTTRVAGKRKFELPPREVRVVDDNPVRELLLSIKPPTVSDPPTALQQQENPPFKIVEPYIKPAPPSQKLAKKQTAKATPASVNRPQSNITRGQDFEYFTRKYERLLGKARMIVCGAIYDLSLGVGNQDCFYSVGKLAQETGFTDRYIFKLVGQLETLGFIEKVETFNTATKKGTIFRLHLEPTFKL
ncbi:MAG: hypothetical protein JST84_04595 [Acidobacteria bacterium]|nr:hypothetical protein [Acidobacteriota bacterium]